MSEVFEKGVKFDKTGTPSNFFMSEKMDGVRAMWDGYNFITRNAIKLPSPLMFKAQMPKPNEVEALGGDIDGELYMGRNTFQRLSGIVRRGGSDWLTNGVVYVAFDTMNPKLKFEDRYATLQELYTNNLFHVLTQTDIPDYATWDDILKDAKEVIELGGEGLMLRRKGSYYTPGRSQNIQKVKVANYGIAEVIGTFPGKGKHFGRIGGYMVVGVSKEIEGKEFKVGTGLTDRERRDPQHNGGFISINYWGRYDSGKPRQPVKVDKV